MNTNHSYNEKKKDYTALELDVHLVTKIELLLERMDVEDNELGRSCV